MPRLDLIPLEVETEMLELPFPEPEFIEIEAVQIDPGEPPIQYAIELVSEQW